MASNRLRALRNVGTRLNKFQSDMSTVRRRPAPKKLATNLILEGNLRRYVATEPIVAPNAITNEKIDDGAVDTEELATDAVTEDKLEIDAVTGKNVTSCMITDSDIENCRFVELEGSDLTVTSNLIVQSNFDLTSGVIAEVEITGPSTLTGDDIVLTNVDLVDVTANQISAAGGGGLSIVAAPLAVDGSFALTGDTVITAGDGFFNVDAGGSFLSVGGSQIRIDSSGGVYSVTFSGQSLTPLLYFENQKADIYEAIAEVQSAVDALGPCACP